MAPEECWLVMENLQIEPCVRYNQTLSWSTIQGLLDEEMPIGNDPVQVLDIKGQYMRAVREDTNRMLGTFWTARMLSMYRLVCWDFRRAIDRTAAMKKFMSMRLDNTQFTMHSEMGVCPVVTFRVPRLPWLTGRVFSYHENFATPRELVKAFVIDWTDRALYSGEFSFAVHPMWERTRILFPNFRHEAMIATIRHIASTNLCLTYTIQMSTSGMRIAPKWLRCEISAGAMVAINQLIVTKL
jgi:hypothetical protein